MIVAQTSLCDHLSTGNEILLTVASEVSFYTDGDKGNAFPFQRKTSK